MLNAMQHRGPDGTGIWSADHGRIILGHQRLAIIDPESGQQPMSNEDGTIWITFNGCIYNYLDLSHLLRQKGHRLRTHSDTEVIIHSYEEWGEDCIHYFIGMFAFAIWDEREQKLFCARDRLGIKPFYYYHAPDSLVFASEIKALLTLPEISAGINPDGLQEYITFQTVLGADTLFKDIKRLEPGHTLVAYPHRVMAPRPYWDLRFDIDTEHDEDYFVEQLRVLLEDAVKIRLRADVPVGGHLSGGQDSSTVVCLANRLLKMPHEDFHTFTGTFGEGPEYDETAYARLVAQQLGTHYHEIVPAVQDFIDHLPRIIYYMDEPAAGPGIFPQYWVAREASNYVTVILGGQGGDEIFIGYARYLIGYLEECLKGVIEETQDRAHYVATLASIIPSLPLLQGYQPLLQYFWAEGLFASPPRRYFRLMDRSEGKDAFYQLPGANAQVYEKFQQLFLNSNARSYINQMQYFDVKVHLAALLQVEDRTSMAWGLESRVPLLDHRLVELMSSIPPVIKFKGGQPKYLFRKVIQHIVPPAVLERKDKMGFPVPLNEWARGPARDFIRAVLLDDAARTRGLYQIQAVEHLIDNERQFSRKLWGLLCLELWCKIFLDRNPNWHPAP